MGTVQNRKKSTALTDSGILLSLTTKLCSFEHCIFVLKKFGEAGFKIDLYHRCSNYIRARVEYLQQLNVKLTERIMPLSVMVA